MLSLPLLRRLRGDHGMVTLLYLGVCGSLLTMVGLIFDGGGELDSYRGADEVAKEAARAEAQCVDIAGFLVTGRATVADPDLPGLADNPTALDPARSCAQPFIDETNSGNAAAASSPQYPTFPGGAVVKIHSITVIGATVSVEVTITRRTVFSTLGFQTVAHGHGGVKLTQGVTDAGG